MNPVLRTLEEWTTHQDYLWFLAALAWGGVLGAELRPKENSHAAPAKPWLIALALAQIAGALVELVLLAQDLFVPYTKLDLAMGVAQAGGAMALVWGATGPASHGARWRVFLLAALGALAVSRFWWPLEAGSVLCLIQAVAVLALLRQTPRLIPRAGGLLLAVAPLVATHGPLAYAIGQGRRTTDWSHFALIAAGTAMAVGALLAAAAWRRRLQEAVADVALDKPLRRDLRRAVLFLVAWLVAGVLLAVWYGRQARRGYEENLLRRTEVMTLALDPQMLVEALGPELRIESIARRHYPDGAPVDVATVPRTSLPIYAALRARLGELRTRNPDLRFLQITTWRQGHLLVAIGSAPRKQDIVVTHTIRRQITPQDLEQLAARKGFVEGPIVTPQWGAQLGVRAPLFHPVSGQIMGWLNAEVDATRWAVTFTQARLQTMALVAAGVGLWILAVAYRLRRETRDAAEQKAATAAAANRMKSAFLAKVSHELRTPIQSILGYGELLDGAPLSDLHRSWVAALRSHGDIMLRLVNDLIDLGALQSGAFQLEPGPVELRALIGECAASLRPAASAKGLAFRSEIAAGVPTWVSADDVRLRQILLNLLTNAVKFTPTGGVVLTVRQSSEPEIEFVVADTGPGIPSALHTRLFQPFTRLDPAAGGGSGLGLALVRGLCTVLGGTVELAEGAGKGATFVLRLPLPRCDAPGGELPAAQPLPPGLTGLQVLVAEDNTLVRELLMAFLTESGAHATFAADGVTALAMARAHAPDVLLLDIGLPRMDGLAVAEALRQDGPSRLRIIGLSAHVSPHDESRARRAGMDAFLAKPVRLAHLAAVISAQMRDARPVAAPSERIADPVLRQRLTAQFASETPRVLTDMRAALAAGDWPQVQRHAHYLKNSADVLGLTALQHACQRFATLAPPHDAAEGRLLLEAMESTIPAEFAVLVDERPAAQP